MAEFVKPVMYGGHTAIFADSPLENAVYTSKSSLLSGGYKVNALVFDKHMSFADKLTALKALPEYIRLFIGIGGGEAAELAKIIAGERNASCAVVVAAPSTDSFAFPVTSKGVFSPPAVVLADKSLISTAPARLVASGVGQIYSSWITLFDLRYAEYLSGADISASDNLQRLLTDFDRLPRGSEFPCRLCECLLRLGAIKNECGITGAADAAGRALSESANLYHGEAAFVAAYAIAFIYRSYLKNTEGAADTLLPSDRIKTRKLLQKKFGINYFTGLTDADFEGYNTYFKHSFIVGEYRADLLAVTELFNMRERQRSFRRVYDDAGFALKSKLSVKELLRTVSLSGEIAAGTFLKQIKEIGFLECCL
jgi:hypothetical protein